MNALTVLGWGDIHGERRSVLRLEMHTCLITKVGNLGGRLMLVGMMGNWENLCLGVVAEGTWFALANSGRKRYTAKGNE